MAALTLLTVLRNIAQYCAAASRAVLHSAVQYCGQNVCKLHAVNTKMAARTTTVI